MKSGVRVAMLSGVLLLAPMVSRSHAVDDPNRHDEFGLKPDDGSDDELSLPDPVLDRNWPAPAPGEDSRPPAIAPDEDEIDPFKDEDAPPPPDERLAPAPTPIVPKPGQPLVGPDGKIDPGTPAAEPDPTPPDPIEPEIDEPSEIDKEDSAPSPLDRGDAEFHKETNDPGDW